jgi:hypothetical protein
LIGASSHEDGAIIFALLTEGGVPRLLVRPNWRRIVQSKDEEYIEAVLSDFRERCLIDPEALLKQLSSLGVGALVTYETGSNLADYPQLLGFIKQFVAL